MSYKKTLETYDAFLALKSSLEDALATCYALMDNHREKNSRRKECYRAIKAQLEACYSVAEKAHTSFSREIKPEDF